MVFVFIAVAIVLAALDGFVFLILKRLVTTTGKSIRRGVIRQLGAYDALFAAKSIELAQMQQKTKTPKKNTAAATEEVETAKGQNTALIPPARYRGEGFTRGYHEIRKGFSVDEKAVFEKIKGRPADKADDEFVKNADSLLSRLGFDALYALSSLGAEEQLEVCLETCSDGEKKIIGEYMKLHERFDAAEFASSLRNERDRRDNTIYIRTPSGARNEFDGAAVSEDPSICEGITLIKHGVLYDYSITEREIG